VLQLVFAYHVFVKYLFHTTVKTAFLYWSVVFEGLLKRTPEAFCPSLCLILDDFWSLFLALFNFKLNLLKKQTSLKVLPLTWLLLILMRLLFFKKLFLECLELGRW
jgi:hypothetical protein